MVAAKMFNAHWLQDVGTSSAMLVSVMLLPSRCQIHAHPSVSPEPPPLALAVQPWGARGSGRPPVAYARVSWYMCDLSMRLASPASLPHPAPLQCIY